VSYSRGPGAQHWHSVDTISHGPSIPQNYPSSALTVWPSADLAIYVPVVVRVPCIVRKLWFRTGDTSSGNYDVGLYTASGTALLRKGSTSAPGINTDVIWNCTDTAIPAGLYYLALASAAANDTFLGLPIPAPTPVALGCLVQASSLPLPASATFALDPTLPMFPVVGMVLNSVVT